VTKFNYGGQAVLEGVMMRGEKDWAVSVRNPAGNIIVHREALPAAVYRSRILRWPFLRGLTMLWDSLGLGMRALMWSADVAISEEDEQVSFSGPLAWGTIALSLALGIGLFFLLPAFLVGLIDRYVSSSLLSNAAEGLVRLLIFVGYIWGISFMPDIRRVFAYHGAEHKTINAYEQGAPLEPEAIMAYSRAHTRCGTAFLIIVLVIFVIVATLVGRPPLLLRLLSRIILIPVVAGISYEVLKLTSRSYERSVWARALAAPGLWVQRLTTREPTREMVEVSIAALKQVLQSEGLAAESAQSSAEAPPAEGPAAVS